MLNHDYIGTEHILLGLIHEGEGIAAQAIESLEISLGAVRREIEDVIGRGQAAPTGHIPFTPRAKKVLELSLREALQLKHNYIGTEHILLGVLREGEGVAAQVLVKLGARLDDVRQRVIELLGSHEGAVEPLIGRGRSRVLGTATSAGPSAMALFNPRAVDAIHLAQAIAARRGMTTLSPEDLLLGLLRSPHPDLLSILTELELDPDKVSGVVSRHLASALEEPEPEGSEKEPPAARVEEEPKTPEEGSDR